MGGGDAAARFEALIRRNGEDLSRYFQRRLVNPADAAEAYGELLLTAWKIRRRMPVDELDARMWLFVTARNVLLNSRRSLARRSAAAQRFVDDARATPPAPDNADLSAEVREAIESLSPDDAELVRLVYWDGLRSHEAAAVLRINPSTARSRLSSAKRQIRARLEATSKAST
nr:sigma-70 family RNA polymerase sigma factor [Microbacterium hydrocarbonoxydans]